MEAEKHLKMTISIRFVFYLLICVYVTKITDINSAMFFQDQCNLPDIINDHTRLQSNLVGKAFECAIREGNGAAEIADGNTVTHR